MKRLLFAIMLMLPILAVAKEPLSAKYLKGGVPEENGIIKESIKKNHFFASPASDLFSALSAFLFCFFM